VRTELDGAVELLDRALGYTRVVLADVTDDVLARPTPCSEWTLGELLAHMEDALDAFIEAAAGVVEVGVTVPSGSGVADLQRKACTLLGAWSRATPGDVRVGGHDPPAACSSPPPPWRSPCTAGTSGRPRVARPGSRRTLPATCSG
jgi:hypothetical protein